MLDAKSSAGDSEEEQAQEGLVIRIPTDLGTWLRWGGYALVLVAAGQTLAFLISISFLAHLNFGVGGASSLDSPPPAFATLLLGVLLLALCARSAELPARGATRWVISAGVAVGLVIAAESVVAGIDRAFHTFSSSSATTPTSLGAAYAGFNLSFGLLLLGYAIVALVAVVIGLALWRATPAAPDAHSEGDQRPVSFRVPVIAGLMGLLIYVGFFVAFEVAIKSAPPPSPFGG